MEASATCGLGHAELFADLGEGKALKEPCGANAPLGRRQGSEGIRDGGGEGFGRRDEGGDNGFFIRNPASLQPTLSHLVDVTTMRDGI